MKMRVGCLTLGLLAALLATVPSRPADASDLDFHAPAAAGDAGAAAAMRDLAGRLVPVYQDPDPDRYLANLSALQMVAGNYVAAYSSRQSLRERRQRAGSTRGMGREVLFDTYAHARALEAENHVAFAAAFATSYREDVSGLNDLDALAVTERFAVSPALAREAWQKLLDQQRAADSIGEAAAVELIRAYLTFDAYRAFGPLVGSLNAEEDRRRYEVDEHVVIKTAAGAELAALLVRPRSAAKTLPALLEFTIYDSGNFAKECAAHGYIGVVAYSRGVRGSGDIVPYQRDGEDARAVIDWITKQPWSDGRVGMYGEGYSGFTAWAAAQHVPAALKAIATSAASAPGVDVPMSGNIFQNSGYRWSLYVTNKQAEDEPQFYDDGLWHALDRKWYLSGRRYRDFGEINGTEDPIFIRWLNHPSYDRFWQSMIPYQKQFAQIKIPVLTMSGYYSGSQPGALYYFTQHYRYDPHADHTLLIGPYDDAAIQRGPLPTLQAYTVDPVALVDLRELRYQWFDHALKGGATPALLQSRVNFEVMGANVGRHAASLEGMAKGSLRFYLDPAGSGDVHRLTQHRVSGAAFIRQKVSLKDRSDAAWMPSLDLISKSLATHNHILYESDPLPRPIEFNGLLSGRLDFTVNKMDMDLNVIVYEHLSNGDYIRLYSPTDEIRASYARDREHRHLLKAGERQQLGFRSERMTSRLLQPGSRLVLILGISKRPDREINYGTGEDVSEESIADGAAAIKIRWYGDSYVDIPIRR
jgi:putative CocE/NonD family hydrolase